MFMPSQLVLQFEVREGADYDSLVALEEILRRNLPSYCEVDGHDVGSAEFNIFVLTERPEEAFIAIRSLLVNSSSEEKLRAAFRTLGEDEYTVLWPESRTDFAIT